MDAYHPISLKIVNNCIISLPPNLIKLELQGAHINCPFPPSLRKLKMFKLEKSTSISQLTHLDCYALPPMISLDAYDLSLITHLTVLYHHHPVFPPNITYLDVKNVSADPSKFFLSSKITHLQIGCTTGLSSLPPLLNHLTLNAKCLPLPYLPNSLISLTLDIRYNHQLPSLPATLKKLLISQNFKYLHRLPELPSSLKYLCLPKIYSFPLPNVPASLMRLHCMDTNIIFLLI